MQTCHTWTNSSHKVHLRFNVTDHEKSKILERVCRWFCRIAYIHVLTCTAPHRIECIRTRMVRSFMFMCALQWNCMQYAFYHYLQYRVATLPCIVKWWEDLPKKKRSNNNTHTQTPNQLNKTKRLNMWWCTFIASARAQSTSYVPFKRKLASGGILMKWFIYWNTMVYI